LYSINQTVISNAMGDNFGLVGLEDIVQSALVMMQACNKNQ
jgi:hypothetical protein